MCVEGADVPQIFFMRLLSYTFHRMLLVIALTGFISFGAVAENGDDTLAIKKDICSKGGQSEMNICMTLEYKKIRSINERYLFTIGVSFKFAEGVKNAQQTWIKYRNAECSNDIFQLSKPNSLSPLVEVSCKKNTYLNALKGLNGIWPKNVMVARREIKKLNIIILPNHETY